MVFKYQLLRGEDNEKMTTYLEPKDTRQVQEKLVEWLNNNLDDPYKQATSKTRSTFVYGDDFKLQGVFPIIHVDISNFEPTRITNHKSNYLEEEEHSFIIYYHCQLNHRYTFADNHLTLTNEAQVMKYLQYIKKKIKSNITDFDTYFHKATFGSISKPVRMPNPSVFIGMIPFTCYTYCR